MYYLLTESFKSQEKALVDMIVKIGSIECIYMLGSSLHQRRTESIFSTSAPTCSRVGHYYLLVSISKSEESLISLQDKIENTCRAFIPVTAIVLYADQFDRWWAEGHPFATTVRKIAVLLFGVAEMPFNVIQKEPNKATVETYLEHGINLTKEFIAGAELFAIRKQNPMALFMLHQATEHGLRAFFKRETGLQVNTHNIDKLIRYCSMISYRIPDIFPRNTDKDKRLFSLLQGAYISSRYKEQHKIKSVDLIAIMEMAKILQHTLEANN